MRLLLIAIVMLSGCTSIPAHRVNDTRWSDYNYQLMIQCGALYSTDEEYSACLFVNGATI